MSSRRALASASIDSGVGLLGGSDWFRLELLIVTSTNARRGPHGQEGAPPPSGSGPRKFPPTPRGSPGSRGVFHYSTTTYHAPLCQRRIERNMSAIPALLRRLLQRLDRRPASSSSSGT